MLVGHFFLIAVQYSIVEIYHLLSLLFIAFGLFSVWGHYEQAAMNMCVRPFGGHMHSCFAYIPRSEITGSKGRCIFVKANIISAIKEI